MKQVIVVDNSIPLKKGLITHLIKLVDMSLIKF